MSKIVVSCGFRDRALALTPVSLGSNPAAEDCLLQFADYNQDIFISHEKHSGSEFTLVSRFL